MRSFQSGLICGAIAALLRTFSRDRRGSVSLYVATAIVPMVAIVGVSIDAARGYLVKSRLSSAVDAAALAGGRIYGSNYRDADIKKYFDANFPPGYMKSVIQPLAIVPNDVSRTITVSTQATIPTTFMRLLGFKTMSASAQAEAKLASKNVEVSLVLDNTGSMGQGAHPAIVDLRSAANELVDIIVQDVQTPFYSKVALVPYSMGVNVGSTYATAVRGSYTNNTCTYTVSGSPPAPATPPPTPTCRYYNFQRYSDLGYANPDQEISTCVTEREGPEAFTDAPPSVALLGRNYVSPSAANNPCIASRIMPLTSDKQALHTRINGLAAAGSTAGHVGVAWGWYLVSPRFNELWTATPSSKAGAYGDEELLKVVIIMTDGEYNSIYKNGVIARNSIVSGSGGSEYKINLDAVNGDPYVQSKQLCTNMKTAGVIVYTVGLNIVSKPAAMDLVEKCATDAGHVYLPANGTALKDAFRAIALQISTLRLSK